MQSASSERLQVSIHPSAVIGTSVFLDQGGLPIPAYPPLVVTAALATDRGESVLPILAWFWRAVNG